MNRDLAEVDRDLAVLHAQAQVSGMDELARRYGLSRELIRQRLSRLGEGNLTVSDQHPSTATDLLAMTGREVMGALLEALLLEDEIALFDVLESGHAAVMWINPLAITGKASLERFQTKLAAEALNADDAERPSPSRTIIILPSASESWLTRDLLRGFLFQPKDSLVLVASRAVLRKTLFDRND